jgi:cytochrome c553
MALIKPRRCEFCHKEDFSGQGETRGWPAAAGLPDQVAEGLPHGERRGRGLGAMMEVSVTLKDEDIQLLAAYLARKP